MIKTLIINFCVVFLILSCTDKNGTYMPSERVEVVRDENGNLKYEISYIMDTLEHGISKYYYPSINVVRDQISFQYGEKNGWHLHYRPNGTLESKVYFRNNKQDSTTFWYFDDGKSIKEQSQWKAGKPYGSALFYYENGKIRLYNSIDAFGETFFVCKWDSSGKKVFDDGMVFSPRFLSNFSASEITILDTLYLDIAVAQVPNGITRLFIGVENEILEELEIRKNSAFYRRNFNVSGKYDLITVGEITDFDGNLIRKDSIVTGIIVTPPITMD
jgi:antitoxin component YwqK of YwqJK toxin-antitoxin module